MYSRRPVSESPALSDTGSFETFYRDHYEAVSKYVERRLSLSVHDEVVADVFVIAWRKYDRVSNPSLPWLYRIASYEVAHERRRVARLPQFAPLNDQSTSDGYAHLNVTGVATAFGQLSANDAELLRLIHWDGLSRADAAEALGCSIGTLNVRYHRAFNRLSSTFHRLGNISIEDRDGNVEDKESQ